MKLLEVEGGGHAPVPHSWRRHCVCNWSSYLLKLTTRCFILQNMLHNYHIT